MRLDGFDKDGLVWQICFYIELLSWQDNLPGFNQYERCYWLDWLGMLHLIHWAIFHCGVLIGRNRGCGVVHVLLVLRVVCVMIIVHILHMHVLRVVNVWYCT